MKVDINSISEVRKLVREVLENYTLSDPPMYGDSDYKKRGGKIFTKSPSDFLKLVPSLDMDEESIENIDILSNHIDSGKEIDPPTLYVNGNRVVSHDGRHRAYAAIKLNIKNIPILVIDVSNNPVVEFDFLPQIKK